MKFLLFLISFFYFQWTLAADTQLTLKEQAKSDEKLENGWHPKLGLGLDISFNSSSSVVGQDDGDTFTIGGLVKSALVYKKDQNEWRQSLNYSGKTAKTPTLPRFVKSADELKYESLYLYSLENYPKIGPYVRVSGSAPIFFGESVQAEDKTFLVSATSENLGTKQSQRLSDGFKPMTTNEAVGLFYKYLERKNTKVEFRLGLGAEQVIAKNQLVVDDDKDTDSIIELKRLNNSDTVGLEYGFTWEGMWNDKSSYSLTGQFLTPVGEDIAAGDVCDSCDDLELTSVDVNLSFKTKINDWASLKYQYRAQKQPKILEDFQITHGLVFGVDYSIF
ncbi:MAG: hypothetical protein R2827_03960 [Bdellovibrionales bacterium]